MQAQAPADTYPPPETAMAPDTATDTRAPLVLTRGELLADLEALRTLSQQYRDLLERAWEEDAPGEEARRLLEAHRELARGAAGPFEALAAVGSLLEFVVERLHAERVTFHLPRRVPVTPAGGTPPLAELAVHLRTVLPPLEALSSRVFALARAAKGASHPRIHRVLNPCASLFKAIVRQDWRDAELVLNHINMVTTSRESHELVEEVGRLVRTIYNSLQEISADLPIETLSEVSEELPDAADKLHSVIRELENTANRNLDMLEELIAAGKEGRGLADEARDVLAATRAELDALADAHPAAAEALRALSDDLQQRVDGPLERSVQRIQACHDTYMTLFANQSFQDLTGQTLKKVIAFIEGLQYQLIQVISKDRRSVAALPHRPIAIDAESGPDASNRLSQDRVDAMLADLGF